MATDAGACTFGLGPGTTVRRLQLRGRVDDAFAARQSIDRALAMADLTPTGLPATAIVVIRRLRDPLPRRWRLDGAGRGIPVAWQQAVSAHIADLSGHAARPALEYVPDSAAAVVFMDTSDLLACLARDWCRGTLNSRWWWRSLMGDARNGEAVLREWLASPEYAPTAMQQLAATRDAVDFARRLNPEMARDLHARIAWAFGLAAPALAPAYRETRTLPAWVPEASAPVLERQQAELLRVSLLLARAPQLARALPIVADEAMATDIDARSPGAGKRDEVQVAAAQRPAVHPFAPDACAYSSRAAISAVAKSLRTHVADTQPPIHRAEQAASKRPGRHEAEDRMPRPAATPDEPASAVAGRARDVPAQPTRPGLGEFGPPRSTRARPTPSGVEPGSVAPRDLALVLPFAAEARQDSSAHVVDSDFAGTLFLINLGLFLDLYGDFSQPQRRGIALPIWDFVAMLGEALAGPSLRADPLWPLLATLAGRRAADEPGCRFVSPTHWRLPVAWLAAFGSDRAWSWSRRGGRLRVCHPAGFTVIDVPLAAGGAAHTLAVELLPYRQAGHCAALARRAAPAHPGASRPRSRAPRRWFGWLWPYASARLCAALGIDATHAGSLLCARAARLRISATHVDAHFRLADLPIEVRLAGLDRDPGWVPAAGRYVAFHFD